MTVTTESAGNSSQKALWFIESHFADALTLDDIASIAGVSRFQMSRAFAAATGLPITRYLRARRLSEAARALSLGAADILTVALDAGYGSHEAFTRAFREQFGTTPEAVRAQGHLENIALMEPIKMDQTFTELEAPRFENSKPMLIAGIGQRYDVETSAGIPAQWQRFMPYFETGVAGQIGKVAYGVACNFDDAGNFEYISGVEVSSFSGLPADWSNLRIGFWPHAGPVHEMPQLPDHWEIINEANTDCPFRLATSPARNFLNTSFTETASSRRKEGRPAVMMHPEDAAALSIGDGDPVKPLDRHLSILPHQDVNSLN